MKDSKTTKTTKNTQRVTKSYTELVISKKENKKNDVYSASTMRLFDVYTSKRNAIVYVHENVDSCVNAQHKNTVASVLKKYNATDNKNYSERDKFKYRVAVSVDTFDAFLTDITNALKYSVTNAQRASDKKVTERAQSAKNSAQNNTESASTDAQSVESESVA